MGDVSTGRQGSALRLLGGPDPAPKYRVFTRKDLDSIEPLVRHGRSFVDSMKAVSAVLPFRINNYVLDELIDWDNVPDDPMFQLTFPQPEMLEDADFQTMYRLVVQGAGRDELKRVARPIQDKLNPHPAGQMELNVPTLGDARLEGSQHKYRETVLFFPAPGQTCHAYCTYCFRWAQFVGIDELKFATRQAESLVAYLKRHQEVTSVLITGGDPLVMKTSVLRRYIEPLLSPELDHIDTIRLGTKSPAYWPHRFVSDDDADDLLRLFDEVADAGRHLAFMAHYSHPRELDTPVARTAVERITCTGAVVRTQAPLIRHVNDSPEVWGELWRTQTRLGAVPYYMFVERNTGPKHYFEVPLARALEIFNTAYRTVSGIGRTVRGPSMSATPGKVLVDGVATIHGEKVFVLKFLQARDPEWVGRPFFAKFDPRASWIDELRPAFGEHEFFYEPGLREIKDAVAD
jgi:KamA family protein